MCGDVGEDPSKSSDAQVFVIRRASFRDPHCYVMLTTLLRREPNVATRFTRNRISVPAKRAGEIAAGEIAGQPHYLRGDDFVMDEVQPDCLRSISFLEMTVQGVANRFS
jgi:hypothetical protein